MHEQPRGRATRLALPGEVHPFHGTVDGAIEIGVREHDDRVLAAEFERDDLDHVGCRARLDRPADRRGPGKSQAPDAGMGDKGVSNFTSQPGDDIHYARRKDVPGQFSESQRGYRRVLGWLDHDGITGDKRRRELGGEKHQRVVERNDASDDAEGMAKRVVESPVRYRDGLAPLLKSEPGEVAELASGDAGVLAHFADRASVVGHVEHGQLVGVFLDQRGQPLQARGAVERWCGPPGPERALRGGYRVVHVGGVAARKPREQLAGRRVVGIDRGAAARFAQLAANEHPVSCHVAHGTHGTDVSIVTHLPVELV